jgi:hypothetical protein
MNKKRMRFTDVRDNPQTLYASIYVYVYGRCLRYAVHIFTRRRRNKNIMVVRCARRTSVKLLSILYYNTTTKTTTTIRGGQLSVGSIMFVNRCRNVCNETTSTTVRTDVVLKHRMYCVLNETSRKRRGFRACTRANRTSPPRVQIVYELFKNNIETMLYRKRYFSIYIYFFLIWPYRVTVNVIPILALWLTFKLLQ